RRIFVHHYPAVAEAVAAAGLYDLVCCGHNHQPEIRRVGKCLLVNPGEVMGRFGHSTYAIYDTESGKADLHEVGQVGA
ncbi:MAG: metallophosphoesterase family protein, partial [Candidatus Methanosuratus sp.]|nr:metallophosphoesterase family protein [Candidatus Methanosuratincola sp.]